MSGDVPRGRTTAVVWSGGKDSMLALDRALAAGFAVQTLFNLYDITSDRVRFHGVHRRFIARQADALDLDLLQRATTAHDFERVFMEGLQTLRQRGITDLVFGNIHLADVRAWYEERTTALGFAHHEPLWDTPPEEIVREFLLLGYRAIITGIDTARARRDWLGRELDWILLDELRDTPGVDAAGEHGEYHTFVLAGPLFREPIPVTTGRVVDTGTHAMIDLL